MSYIKIGLSTYCPDTPHNRREFEEYCARISRPAQKGDTLLSRQIAKENKQLKSLRVHLPGYEPDRFRR